MFWPTQMPLTYLMTSYLRGSLCSPVDSCGLHPGVFGVFVPQPPAENGRWFKVALELDLYGPLHLITEQQVFSYRAYTREELDPNKC